MRNHVLAAVAVAVLAAPAFAGEKDMPAAAKTPKSFDTLKALVGEWREVKKEKASVIRYDLVAGGTALMESINPGTDHSMISIYHPDGEKIVMTHYCAVGNQPRMRGDGDAKSVTFTMVDITNLPDPKSGHMEGLTITFVDPDHLVHEWRWRAGDKTEVHRFEVERKKSS